MRQLLIAVLSGVLGRAVTLIAPLLVMGPMLEHLGPVLFGVWITAVAVSSMASVLDFGIGNAALTRLSEAFGRDDLTAVRRILGEAYALLGGISAMFIVLVIAGATLVQELVATAEAAKQAVVVAIVLSALFLSFPALLITRLMQARHAFLQSQAAQVVGPLVALVACLGGIGSGIGPVGVIALYALPNTMILLVWTGAYFLSNSVLRPSFSGMDRRSMRSMLALGGAFFVLSIFSLTGMNADNVILATNAGVAAVAEYGVPAKLGSSLMLIVGIVFMPLWPLFGDALARDDRAWLATTTWRMSIGGAACVLAVGLGLTAFADPIMNAWMERPFADQKLILLGWTVAATVISLTAPYNMVLNAAGMARVQILPWATFVAVSVGAKALFLTSDTAWWAPWITAGVYVITIAPWMIIMAWRVITQAKI